LGQSALLASAYRSCLQLAVQHGIKSIAFPSLSTGAYGYPATLATGVALAAVVHFIKDASHCLENVTFVLFDSRTLAAYEDALNALR